MYKRQLEAREGRLREQRDALQNSEFTCPITQSVMEDPVSTLDGQTYERAAIEAWLAKKRTSPLTGTPLESTKLIPNVALRNAIQRMQKEEGRAKLSSQQQAVAAARAAAAAEQFEVRWRGAGSGRMRRRGRRRGVER